MKTVFLCYEMEKATGLSYVKEVSAIVGFAIDFTRKSTCNRIEEWIVDGHRDGSGLINTFYSEQDFEARK